MDWRFAAMRRTLAALILLGSAATAGDARAAEAYRYVDERGNVVYTDQWRRGAHRVEPAPGGVVPAPEAVKRRTEADREAAARPRPRGYDRVEIGAPARDAVVWDDGEGHLDVSVAVSPELQAAHRLRATLDGAARDGAFANNTLRLSDMERGTYTLQVEVVDDAGRTLAASEPVVFHYHKHSKLAPTGPTIYPRPTPLPSKR
jgi:Domain of unknown function (DUF4124)